MIAKELRDAAWKVLVASVIVLVALLAFRLPTPYPLLEDIAAYTDVQWEYPDGSPIPGASSLQDPVALAMQEMAVIYNAGGLAILLTLAGLLGATLVAAETGSGTIFSLLSRPVSRTRILLTKYAVCAGALLACAVFGGALLVVAAALRGYPLENLNVAGAALSAGLIWLGSLFVLGVALFMSVIFRNVVWSVVATALGVYLVFALPQLLLSLLYEWQFRTGQQPGSGASGPLERAVQYLNLGSYWVVEGLYLDGSVPITNFLVSLTAAAAMLLAALWLFRRKAF